MTTEEEKRLLDALVAGSILKKWHNSQRTNCEKFVILYKLTAGFTATAAFLLAMGILCEMKWLIIGVFGVMTVFALFNTICYYRFRGLLQEIDETEYQKETQDAEKS